MAEEPTLPTDPPPVMIHPPLLVLFVAVDVALLEWFAPVGVMAGLPRFPLMLVGGLALLGGVFLLVAAALQMKRQGTNIPTFQPTKRLVTDGVFAYSRNPIYLGLVTAMAGFGFLVPSFWLLLGTGITAVVLHYGVIKREEAYLTTHFGPAYQDYSARTARWYGRLTP